MGDVSKVIATIHGWSSPWSGRFDIDYLAPTFRSSGYAVEPFRYGWHLSVTSRNEKWAAEFARTMTPGSVVVVHSNGAQIALISSWAGAQFSTVVLIAPALSADAVFGPSVKRIICLYSPLDTGIRIVSWLPGHPWGTAGIRGMNDPRAENHDRRLLEPPGARSALHLDWSWPATRVPFARWIIRAIEAG